MSKTRGHTKSIKEIGLGRNKLKPYLADKDAGSPKFVVSLGKGTGISKTGKLVTKNANRSKKKAARQQTKKEINQELQQIITD
jgi:hypothetical protein